MSDTSESVESAVDKSAYEPAKVVRHIAHELRQPLSTIESIAFYLDMVLPRTEGKARRHLGKLQQEVQRINWILTDAIHFLRAAEPNPQPLDLSELVAKSLSEWTPEDGARACLQLKSNLPLAALDAGQIEHMLRNLLVFLGQLAAPGAAITFKTYSAPPGVVLEAATTTAESAGDNVRAMFEPFEGALPAGSGLKLASARRIAEAHDARIEIHTSTSRELAVVAVFPPVAE